MAGETDLALIETIYYEFTGFFELGPLYDIVKKGDFSVFRSFEGIKSVAKPVVPLVLAFEVLLALFKRNFHWPTYKVNFITYVVNRVLRTFIVLTIVALILGYLEPYAILDASVTWYWFIYAYIVWEFSHFIYHYSCHKVRLLWCLHSTHHAPENMNMSVAHAHFFLEGPYATIVRVGICTLAGIPPELLILVTLTDTVYGSLIHISPNILRDGRLGWLNPLILTPNHHRIHHARNPVYMDTNFCNLLNIWDRIFGTYQKEQPEIALEYGITREMKKGSWLDAYFGEIYCLARDVWNAPGLRNKLLYLVMPPGWSHTGDHKTASLTRQRYLAGASA